MGHNSSLNLGIVITPFDESVNTNFKFQTQWESSTSDNVIPEKPFNSHQPTSSTVSTFRPIPTLKHKKEKSVPSFKSKTKKSTLTSPKSTWSCWPRESIVFPHEVIMSNPVSQRDPISFEDQRPSKRHAATHNNEAVVADGQPCRTP